MTKNTKIALGCGGVGCLGIILAGVIGLVIYFYTGRNTYRNYNYNSNYNTNVNRGTNRNTNQTSTTNSSNSSSSSLSDDDKHKLFQAAAVTADLELIRRVNVKIGILEDDFTPGEKFQEFTSAHPAWAARNTEFVLEMSNAAKAREYIEAHIDD